MSNQTIFGRPSGSDSTHRELRALTSPGRARPYVPGSAGGVNMETKHTHEVLSTFPYPDWTPRQAADVFAKRFFEEPRILCDMEPLPNASIGFRFRLQGGMRHYQVRWREPQNTYGGAYVVELLEPAAISAAEKGAPCPNP